MTGSGVMAIFVYKGLTGNSEIGTTPVWVLVNIWRLGQIRDTKLGSNVTAFYVTAFTVSELLKENQQANREGVKLPPPTPPPTIHPPRLELKSKLNKEGIVFSKDQL